ncbi:MAG TPA: flavodoxin family protein [Dehalococcoidia bacterium]|nr:flavodoxin family protein [Dehalococcoidia bacterium]
MVKKILCVGGSPRAGGNSDILIRHFLNGIADAEVTGEDILLRDYQFRTCTGCEMCRKDKTCTGLSDDMQFIYPKIMESCGLILVSPVHNYNITAIMKSFIDRLYCFYDFDDERPGKWSSRLGTQGRKAVIAAVAEQIGDEESGMNLTLKAMRLPLEALGYEIIAELPVTGVFKKGKVLRYPEFLDSAESLGKRLGIIIKNSKTPDFSEI